MITLDFETYHTPMYSLKKLTTVEYVRDPRFKIWGCGIKIDHGGTQWLTDPQQIADTVRGTRGPIVGHNLLFDGLILVEKLGIPPTRVWIDTLAIAKAKVQTTSYKLGDLATLFALPTQKQSGVIKQLEGVEDPDPELLELLGIYCKADVDCTYELFKKLGPLPKEEARLSSLTTRMGIHAQLHLCQETLRDALETAKAAQIETIQTSGIPTPTLKSNKKFAEWVTTNIAPVPTKISPRTGLIAPALSKGDLDWIKFQQLHHTYQHVFDAREAATSNLPITRAQTLLNIATTGTLPVPLQYYGGHTGRFSGRDGYNLQNLPRGSLLRQAIMAPKGHTLVVGDLSQIEVRVLALLANEQYLLEAFAQHADPYKEFAAKRNNKLVADVTKNERQFAKAMILGLGFGMGVKRFQNEVQKGFLGSAPVDISLDDATQAVQSYRTVNQNIVAFWQQCNQVLEIICAASDPFSAHWNAFTLHPKAIQLPNGMSLLYEGLRQVDGDFSYQGKRIWGGSLTENLVQAMARIVMTDALLETERQGLNPVLTCHDEIVCCVPEATCNEAAAQLRDILTTNRRGYETLPLDATIGIDHRYTK